MLGELDEEKVSSLYRDQMSTLKTSYTRFKSAGLDGVKSSHPGGPCIPGAKKLFVDVHGNFYPCEKVSEQEIFQIGNLWDGIDENRAASFLNVGKYTEEECKSCWAFSVCTTCAVAMVEGKELSRDKRLKKCQEVRSSVLSTWQDIETLKYYGYDFEEEGRT